MRKGSPAEAAGVRAGDELAAVGGHTVGDAVDLAYALGWLDDATVPFEFLRGGERFTVALPPEHPDRLGVSLAEPPVRTCGNRCVFCFVDQLPRGLRRGLYVKDEDYRLSFTHGNYVTLTNLEEEDYERIARQHLSPLYVSVHATDDTVRRRMLGNDGAPPILECLSRLGDAGVSVHVQIVVCPEFNEGAVLERTLGDLFDLGEMLRSVAVVPVGLTAHRSGLPHVDAVSPEVAAAALDSVLRWQKRYVGAGRARTVYAADELYLRADRPLPTLEEYDDLPQLENGVGLLRSFERELEEGTRRHADAVRRPLNVTLVTGELAAEFIESAVTRTLAGPGRPAFNVVAARNELLGPSITVAGLLSGGDLARALADAGAGSDIYLVPAAAFNDDGRTLDDMTASDISRAAGVSPVVAADDIVRALVSTRGRAGAPAGAGGAQ